MCSLSPSPLENLLQIDSTIVYPVDFSIHVLDGSISGRNSILIRPNRLGMAATGGAGIYCSPPEHTWGIWGVWCGGGGVEY